MGYSRVGEPAVLPDSSSRNEPAGGGAEGKLFFRNVEEFALRSSLRHPMTTASATRVAAERNVYLRNPHLAADLRLPAI